MSVVMEEEIKRWTARRKSALVLESIQGKTTVAEASRQYDLTPSEIEDWMDQGKVGMENALKAKPEDVREQYEKQLKDLQEACGGAMLVLRAPKNCSPCWARTRRDHLSPAGTEGRRLRGLDQQVVSVVRRGQAQRVLQADQSRTEGQVGVGGTDQGHDRGRAVLRLSHRGRAARHEHEHRTADLPDQGLAGVQAGGRPSAAVRSVAFGGYGAGSTMGGRPLPDLGRP